MYTLCLSACLWLSTVVALITSLVWIVSLIDASGARSTGRNAIIEIRTLPEVPSASDDMSSTPEIYGELKKLGARERTRKLLDLMVQQGALVLPKRGNTKACLHDVDLSPENLKAEYRELLQVTPETDCPVWWDRKKQIANLTNANLSEAELMRANLHSARLVSATLTGANLSHSILCNARLQGARLQGASLYNSDLRGANLSKSKLAGAFLIGADLRDTDLHDAELDEIFIYGALLEGARGLSRKQLGKRIGEEKKGRYEKARVGYLRLKKHFSDNGDYRAASWAYRKERLMEKKQAMKDKDHLKIARDTLVEVLCNYGDSYWRVLFWMGFLLFIIGPVLFHLVGLSWPESTWDQLTDLSGSPPEQWWYMYQQSLLYTLDTFTTASFSQLKPSNDWTRFLSGMMALSGIFLAGLLGFVVGNRIKRN